MTAMSNRYSGTCAACSKAVPPNAGVAAKVGGAWRVWHAACTPKAVAAAPAAAAAPAVVRVTLAPEGVEVTVTGRLGDLFAAYKAAQDGAGLRWHRDTGRVTGTERQALAFLLAAGQIGGLTLTVDPAVRARLDEVLAAERAEVEAAAARAEQVDGALAARGGGLYAYQRTGVAWLAPRASALLADDMGLGKTLQALLAAPAGAPVLIVCPAVAKPVWAREAARWRPDLTVTTLSGRGSFRWPTPGEIVVINYDLLPATLISPAPAGTVVVADEAHALKSAKAQRTERFRALAESARAAGGRSWLLTATPILNRPPELYALLRAAGAERAIGGWSGLVREFGGVQDRWGGWSWSRRASAAVIEQIKGVMLRRNKAEVLADLPPKRVEVLEVEIDKAALRDCDLAVKAAEKRGGLDAVLRDVAESAGGAGFEQIAKARASLAVAKAAAVQPLLDAIEEEEAGPVVVFSAHRAAVDVLGARAGWATITGDTPAEERGRIEEAFQAGSLQGVAGTIKAMGVAITLTRATRAVFLDEEWTPALNQQAQDRIYRIGQRSATLITRLVANHAVDRRVVSLLDEKQALLDGSVERVTRSGSEEVSSLTQIDLDAIHTAAADSFADARERDAELAALAAELEAADEARRTKQALRDAEDREDRESKGDEARRFAFLVGRAARRRREAFSSEPRAAANEREAWAADTLATVAGMDLDFASEENDVGFNKSDCWRGHALASLATASGLDDAGWREAYALACRYAGQVGNRPSFAA
jgi:superfamily II DNA or RNA helicase